MTSQSGGPIALTMPSTTVIPPESPPPKRAIHLAREIVASTAGWAFLLDLPWHLRYTAVAGYWFETKGSDQRIGKAVSPMCLSPYFMHVTREALVQRQLLQCRTCGSQAFHVVDCCRNPDYARVPTSPLGERLKVWLGAVQARIRTSLFLTHQRPAAPVSPAALDAWEARPLTLGKAEDARALRGIDTDKAMEEVDHETLSARR
jgi:hypothetical protein